MEVFVTESKVLVTRIYPVPYVLQCHLSPYPVAGAIVALSVLSLT